MTTTYTAPDETDLDDENDPDTGGSPGVESEIDESQGRPGGDREEPGDEEGESASDDPKTGTEKDSGQSTRLRELEEQNEQLASIVAELDARMARNPALRKMLESDGAAPAEDEDLFANLDRALENFNPDAAKVLRDTMAPIIKKVVEQDKLLSGIRPRIDGLSRTVGSARFAESLVAEGVDQRSQRDPDFQRTLKELRREREFQSLEARAPDLAARFVADRFIAKRGRAAMRADEQRRAASARNGRDLSTGRGSAGARKVIDVVRTPGTDYIGESFRQRQKNPGATIRFVDPK